MKGLIRKINSALMLLRIAGFRVFFTQLMRQVYSKESQLGLELKLPESNVPPIQAKINYTLRVASAEDIQEALQKASFESKASVQKLLYRKWLYESGFRNWYVARTVDDGDLCYLHSVIESNDYKVAEGDFSNWLPVLKNDEALLEGAYTFEKYRGQKLSSAITVDLINIYKKKGFKRMLTYIEKKNTPAIKVVEATGFTKFGEVPVLRVLFFNLRKFNKINP